MVSSPGKDWFLACLGQPTVKQRFDSCPLPPGTQAYLGLDLGKRPSASRVELPLSLFARPSNPWGGLDRGRKLTTNIMDGLLVHDCGFQTFLPKLLVHTSVRRRCGLQHPLPNDKAAILSLS